MDSFTIKCYETPNENCIFQAWVMTSDSKKIQIGYVSIRKSGDLFYVSSENGPFQIAQIEQLDDREIAIMHALNMARELAIEA